MKEREEMWQKIEELARLNPQVCNSRIWDRQNKNVLGELGLLPELMRAGCSTSVLCTQCCSVPFRLCFTSLDFSSIDSGFCWSGCVY